MHCGSKHVIPFIEILYSVTALADSLQHRPPAARKGKPPKRITHDEAPHSHPGYGLSRNAGALPVNIIVCLSCAGPSGATAMVQAAS